MEIPDGYNGNRDEMFRKACHKLLDNLTDKELSAMFESQADEPLYGYSEYCPIGERLMVRWRPQMEQYIKVMSKYGVVTNLLQK
jgi:hypothetical protein